MKVEGSQLLTQCIGVILGIVRNCDPYKRIQEACLTGGYPEPEWQELGTAVRIIFRPHPEVEKSNTTNDTVNDTVNDPDVPINVPVNARQKWFIEQLAAGRNVKATGVAEYFKVVAMTAKRDIAELKERDVIVFAGSLKTGRYQLKEG